MTVARLVPGNLSRSWQRLSDIILTDFVKSLIHNGNRAKIKINSICTVFAESEVISLIAKGIKREFISSAIHNSIASRVISLTKRVGVDEDIVFAGGCAKNPYLKVLLEEGTQKKIHVYDLPEMLAALGAALYASEEA